MERNSSPQNIIREITGASRIVAEEEVQSLWSGYGSIKRCQLEGAETETVIVKHIRFPNAPSHPRGWNTATSHERKVKSYQVESSWYSDYASECDEECRVPKCFGSHAGDNEHLFVMEDLDGSGFPVRKDGLRPDQLNACLKWLAHFHAIFMNEQPINLWSVGTYWHLDTRPDELEALDDLPLKQAASNIDHALSNCRYMSFVHGDAKLANFCFSENGENVAAVDFQYVGGGCGMKDLAYFVGSCLDETACERYETQILDNYFNYLSEALKSKQPDIDANEVEREWRPLYRVSWADFHRFVKGWSPGHWKINSYSENVARSVIKSFDRG